MMNGQIILCEKVMLDGFTNQVSLHHIIRIGRCFSGLKAAFYFDFCPEKLGPLELRVTMSNLSDPNSRIRTLSYMGNGEVNITPIFIQRKSYPGYVNEIPLTFDKPGHYVIDLHIDDVLTATHHVEVKA